jgi:hypothetical protein
VEQGWVDSFAADGTFADKFINLDVEAILQSDNSAG